MKAVLPALLLISSVANADIIRCSFTEPFVNSTYSTSQSTLTYRTSEGQTIVIKNVSFQIKEAGFFELVDKNNKVIQTLTLNHQGSDGMSDIVYPYDAKDTRVTPNALFGGCESNYLKAKK